MPTLDSTLAERYPDSMARATYDDLLKLPEHVVGEILEGELVVSPRPASPHAHASSGLAIDIGGSFGRDGRGPGGWWILVEPELHLGADVVVPDLAGWRRERMAKLPSVPAFELPPDWVCEVISPSTAKHDRGPKRRIYARVGVPHLWFVDPIERTLEVFRLRDGLWTLLATHADQERVRAEPFDAVELEIARWWIEP